MSFGDQLIMDSFERAREKHAKHRLSSMSIEHTHLNVDLIEFYFFFSKTLSSFAMDFMVTLLANHQ